MGKQMDKFREVSPIISLITFCLIFLMQCNSCRKTSRIEERQDALVELTDSISKVKAVTADDVMVITDEAMLNFLIYEDDLDKGKISLSEIKDKLEEKYNK